MDPDPININLSLISRFVEAIDVRVPLTIRSPAIVIVSEESPKVRFPRLAFNKAPAAAAGVV